MAAGDSKKKAAGKAKGARAKAKAGAAGSSGSGRARLSLAQRAQQKLRENFKNLNEDAQYVKLYPQTCRTLYQQLMIDIERKDSGDNSVVFGHRYYEQMTNRYSEADSLFGLLRPDVKDETPVNDKLLEVIFKVFSYLYKRYIVLFLLGGGCA